MRPIKLYQIPQEWAAVEDAIEAAGGEITPEIEAQIVALMGATKDKIIGAAVTMRNYRIAADATRDMAQRMSAEAERVMASANKLDKVADRIGAAMLPAVEVTGKVQTPAGTVYKRVTPHYAFELKDGCNWYDLPSELWRQREPELNKNKLKELAQSDRLPEAILAYKTETTSICLTNPKTKDDQNDLNDQGDLHASNQESCA